MVMTAKKAKAAGEKVKDNKAFKDASDRAEAMVTKMLKK